MLFSPFVIAARRRAGIISPPLVSVPFRFPMKSLSVGLGLLAVLLLGALFYQHRNSNQLHAELVALQLDRGASQAELLKLGRQVADLEARAATAAAAAEKARVASAVASKNLPEAKTENTPPPPPAARPGVTVTAPAGWGKNGAKPESYTVGVDSTQTWGGMASAYVESHTPTVAGGFGGMMQTTAADDYSGKRVRLSGWVKTEDANEGGGHLWLRIDGQERGQMLGFDNMDNRAVKGTKDWQEASVVLDVPAGARALAYGFFVSGGGKMWVNGQNLEVVGPDVPATDMITNTALPNAPRNLGFSPTPSPKK